MPALQLSGIEMAFPGLDAPALSIPALNVPAGAQVAVAGPSGSGKSTLVNVITGLERPGRGRVLWGGQDIATLSEPARDRWRGAHIGLVMQDFHLFPGLSALENVLLPARLARVADRALEARAAALLAEVGLARPSQRIETLSRGEMQRTAVARALLRAPGVIVADEPTASLDTTNAAAIGDLLIRMAARSGATLIVVSHDPALLARLPRQIVLRGGTVAEDRAEAA
ncbi:ABC transporter ATP-binding protein [Paenirhodobacter sp.]|uniref:ABC transporter ATP-binding protein n=1 Tax=Paenirhodobacter sp. TaxID=1965326 RepID=UPI003B51533E